MLDTVIRYLIVFAAGGLLCVFAQILIDKTNITPARILVIYVSAGVILYALGLYEPLVEFAGAGARTPLTGFGYCIAKGVREEIDSRGLLGILTGGLTAGSAGITAALVFGYIVSLLFRARAKK